jgi:DNA-binding NtrC family response regulator
MKEKESTSILKGKAILAVDDEPDVLDILEEEIKAACGECFFDRADNYRTAKELLASYTYDLVILDIMGVNGFDLLTEARVRNFPVVMLTAHALSPEALKKSIELGAKAYLPKEKLADIVPFLEDALRHELLPGWKRLFEKLGDYFNNRFGAGWQNKEERFWKEFNDRIQ